MKYLVLFLFNCFTIGVPAQVFITEGVIRYEKRVNMHRLFDDGGEWVSKWKKETPAFETVYFDLTFSGNQTLYQPAAPEKQPASFREFFLPNTVYINNASHTYTASKEVFDELYLVHDSLRAITWKITNDTRTIAGFDCRKAVGTIFDSLIVIAFYTDAIVPAGGPESFSGLPGMILGIAIPRLHTTWYATGVQLSSRKDLPLLAPPRRGKEIDNEVLTQLLKKNTEKQAGHQYGQLYTWMVRL